MSDDDPFMVVKPDNENKRMSSYLKKNGRSDRKKDVETSSNGSASTRSTATSTAQDTLFSTGKTPESKSKESTGEGFGGFGDTSAIEFNSDFGNGLEFGGFGSGDDGFGTAPQPSNSKKDSRDSKKKTNNSFDAFNPEAFGDTFDSEGFGGSFKDNEGFGTFNERQEPINFGDDGFNAAFGENSRSQQGEQHTSKDEAWKKREAWKNQARSSSSSSSGNRRGGSHRRAPGRTGSKGDTSGMDLGSGHGHPDDNPRAPRSDRHMMSRGEGHPDDSPRAPRSERLLGSRGEGHPDDNPRAPRSDRHMMSRGEAHPDDNPRAPRSERLLGSRGEGHADDNPRAPRSERHMMSRGEGHPDDNPKAPRSERLLGSRGEQERSPHQGERSPIVRNRSGTGPRQRRNNSGHNLAEAPPPQRGPPAEPERGNGRPQRSRRRASLAQPSKSEGNMDGHTRPERPERPARSNAPPKRNQSVDGMSPPIMDHLSGHSAGRMRARRRGSVGMIEAPGASDPMQLNVPHTGPPRAPPKEFLRNRSDNQQKIMDMYKGGALTGDQAPKSERLDISIDTVPDASLGYEPHGGGGLGLGKIFGGKSKKADKLGDNSDHGSGSAGEFVIPDHEPPKRAPRRGSLAFTRKKIEEPKEADYTENRNIEGRSRATLLERVAATADKPSCNGDAGPEGAGASYSDRILGAQRRR